LQTCVTQHNQVFACERGCFCDRVEWPASLYGSEKPQPHKLSYLMIPDTVVLAENSIWVGRVILQHSSASWE